jgi:hypothetical protein
MTPSQYNELIRQAEVIEKDKENKWKEIEEDYQKDEYPVFGGPFTDALTPWEWLKKYYNPPTRKSEGGSYSDLEKLKRGRSKH